MGRRRRECVRDGKAAKRRTAAPQLQRRNEGRSSRLNLAVLLVLLWPLFGCGRSGENRPGGEGSAVTTVVFKHFRIPQGEFLTKLLRDFEREHPNIRVKEETLPTSSDEQHQFYVTNLEARSPEFDVFGIDVIWVQEFARAGWLEDVSPAFSAEELDNFLPAPRTACTFSDTLYAAPWYVDAGVLYYRKDLLAKYAFDPPGTFDELVHSSQVILEGERNPELRGFIWQGKQYEGLVCNVLEFIWSNRGDVITDGRVTVDSPQCVEALRFIRDLIVRYKVSPEMVLTGMEESTRHLFGAGKAIYMRNWPYAWNLFQDEGSSVRGKVGVIAMPHFEGGESAATLGGWQLGVNRYSRKKEAAVALVKFLSRYESQKYVVLTMGFKPSRLDVYDDPDVLREQPFIADLKSVLLKARPRPVTPYYLMISQILQSEFSAALSGIRSPERSLSEAQKQVSRILGLEKAAER
ncbi:MAG TPA: ABC transporter substrate-binding protein [Bacteroidota bacterium]